jgi:TonB family protein
MPARLTRILIRMAAVAVAAGIVLELRHYVLDVRPPSRSNVQRVTVINPRPEPQVRREPEAKQPEPSAEPSAEIAPFFKFDDYAPGPASAADDGPPGPLDDALGLDTAGHAGSSDSYGLVGKRGGRDITTIGSLPIGSGGGGGPTGHGQGGPMAKFAGYAALLKDAVLSELNRHGELRVANYETTVMLWIGSDGRVKRASVSKSSGLAKMDRGIQDVLLTAQTLSPPPDMPQPVHLRIVSQGAMEPLH